jgi:hypothetical protein
VPYKGAEELTAGTGTHLSRKMSVPEPGYNIKHCRRNVMRGPIRIGLLAVSLVWMFAFSAAAALGDSTDDLRDTKRGVLLRDVDKTPTNQPAALELVNNGDLEVAGIAGLETPIICKQVEFGTTVARAKATVANPSVLLAIPFAVAEGDECTLKAGGLTIKVPIYFDTLASGAVGNGANGSVATAAIADNSPGEAINGVTFHNLKFSLQWAVKFCVANLDGLTATTTNVTAGFVEEMPPNLNAQFTNVTIPFANGEGSTGCPTEGKLTANFFLETPSTGTDTAWFESP